MTTGAWLLLVIAGVLAVGNWISRIHPPPPGQVSRLEYVCKPGTPLVLSLTGDVFLMLPDDRFVAGLAAFLLAHVAYVVGLNLHTDGNWWWAGPVVVVVGFLGVRLVRGIRRSGASELVVPVVVYVVVIAAMGISALASGNRWAAVGAVLFMASDSLIGETRFVRPAAWAPVAIMVTYHLGQAGLVLSLVWS